MNTLLYYIAFGDPDARDAQMSIDTARAYGYRGQIVVVSDADRRFDGFVRSINVKRNPQVYARLLTDNSTLLWQRRGGAPKINYLLTRKIPHDILDTSPFDRILFVDTDVLFHGNIEEHLPESPDVVWGQRDNSTMLANIQRLGDPLQPGETVPDRPGLCTGLFCLPRKLYPFSKQWHDLYLQFRRVNGKRQHQASFNLALHRFHIPVNYLLGVGAQDYNPYNWVTHFWVEHRAKMKAAHTYLINRAIALRF